MYFTFHLSPLTSHSFKGGLMDRKLAELALEIAQSEKADYCDVRVIRIMSEAIDVKNGSIDGVKRETDVGMGIRVLFDGAWGFAGNPDLKPNKVEIAARRALEIARASARLRTDKVKLAPAKRIEDKWISPRVIDPFEVSLEEKIEFLLKADKEMRKVKDIKITTGHMDFRKECKIFLNSEGTFIEQDILHTGSGISAMAVNDQEMQVRSFPSSFRGQFKTEGYELIKKLNLEENACRIAEEACALLSAKQCPEGLRTIILGQSQLALQVHESCGHPTELDRVLGSEANYAGMSFLTLDKLNNFQYGSEQVNIVVDATCPGGLGMFGYDDEGVPAQCKYLIKNGILVEYLTSRETAPVINKLSNGTMRADGWNNLPLIRMTNINLLPGNISYEDLIESTDDGILLCDNRSWSIDDKRLNFQFGTEIGWKIKKGKIAGIVKNPTYTGITPEFWNSCDAISDKNSWDIWGTPNCGKGQPPQTARVGHGVSYARFRNVKVGVGYAG